MTCFSINWSAIVAALRAIQNMLCNSSYSVCAYPHTERLYQKLWGWRVFFSSLTQNQCKCRIVSYSYMTFYYPLQHFRSPVIYYETKRTGKASIMVHKTCHWLGPRRLLAIVNCFTLRKPNLFQFLVLLLTVKITLVSNGWEEMGSRKKRETDQRLNSWFIFTTSIRTMRKEKCVKG